MADKPEGAGMLLALARTIVLVGAATALNATRRAGATLAGYLVAGVLLAVSAAFLTFSGYQALVQVLGTVYAALIVGCAYLMAALIAIVIVQMRRR